MRLLLAVDLDDGAEDLLVEGVRWAARLGGVLDLLYVDENAYSVYIAMEPGVQTVLDREWERLRHQRQERLELLSERIPEERRGRASVVSGRASDVIVEAATGHDAVLVGTHGRRGLAHALLGSVAERVVRRAPVAVLVLRRVG